MFKTEDYYTNDYLAFLGLDPQPPSLDYLGRLMETHLYKVPFDGSNFPLNRPEKFSLNNKQILADFKNGKGGICYQMNSSFSKLLRKLGFDAILVTTTMHRFGKEEFPYARHHHDVHCAILVKLNQKEYLLDLVWGNAFRVPFPVGEEITNPSGVYRIDAITTAGIRHFQFNTLIDGEWLLQYEFVNENKKASDFKNDIRFICSDEHHLSKRLLLMKPKPQYKFNFVVGEKYGSLFYIKAKADHTSQKEEIKGERARQVLRKFQVDDDNITEISRYYKI